MTMSRNAGQSVAWDQNCAPNWIGWAGSLRINRLACGPSNGPTDRDLPASRRSPWVWSSQWTMTVANSPDRRPLVHPIDHGCLRIADGCPLVHPIDHGRLLRPDRRPSVHPTDRDCRPGRPGQPGGRSPLVQQTAGHHERSSHRELRQDLASEDLDPAALVAAHVVEVDQVEPEVDELLDFLAVRFGVR